jgi:hypothetical protein
MQFPETEIGRMIAQLNEFILPNSLMESFDMYREESVKSPLSVSMMHSSPGFWTCRIWCREPGDRKGPLVDIFDPGMYTCDQQRLGVPRLRLG